MEKTRENKRAHTHTHTHTRTRTAQLNTIAHSHTRRIARARISARMRQFVSYVSTFGSLQLFVLIFCAIAHQLFLITSVAVAANVLGSDNEPGDTRPRPICNHRLFQLRTKTNRFLIEWLLMA